jgi:hypothetical protein
LNERGAGADRQQLIPKDEENDGTAAHNTIVPYY